MIDFNQFWKLYPRRDKKIPARKAWDKLSLEQQQAAITYLELDPYAGREKCWMPQPTSFINQERWEDEIIEQPRVKEEWEKIPKEDDLLVTWARKHGFGPPGDLDSYFQYRQKLAQKIKNRLATV